MSRCTAECTVATWTLLDHESDVIPKHCMFECHSFSLVTDAMQNCYSSVRHNIQYLQSPPPAYTNDLPIRSEHRSINNLVSNPVCIMTATSPRCPFAKNALTRQSSISNTFENRSETKALNLSTASIDLNASNASSPPTVTYVHCDSCMRDPTIAKLQGQQVANERQVESSQSTTIFLGKLNSFSLTNKTSPADPRNNRDPFVLISDVPQANLDRKLNLGQLLLLLGILAAVAWFGFMYCRSKSKAYNESRMQKHGSTLVLEKALV